MSCPGGESGGLGPSGLGFGVGSGNGLNRDGWVTISGGTVGLNSGWRFGGTGFSFGKEGGSGLGLKGNSGILLEFGKRAEIGSDNDGVLGLVVVVVRFISEDDENNTEIIDDDDDMVFSKKCEWLKVMVERDIWDIGWLHDENTCKLLHLPTHN